MGDGVTLPRASGGDTRQSARRSRIALVGVFIATLALAASISRVLRRVEVAGDSMLPALAPGDRLLVLRHPRWRWRAGQLAAFSDPRDANALLLVKRVVAVTPGGLDVRGDNPAASTDSRTFGPVPRSLTVGPVLYRYWPRDRAGRLGEARVRAESPGTLRW
jgi:nickel-type superoxide dismutase maturation protease